MRFEDDLIEMAIRFKKMKLDWEPAVGHYVYDADGVVESGSPFQDGVYFLLNYDCFMQRVGGVQRFKQIMTWLPTWEDAREILRSLGVTDREIQQRLMTERAIEEGEELRALYHAIDMALRLTNETHSVSQPTIKLTRHSSQERMRVSGGR